MKTKVSGAEAPFDICWDKQGIAHVFAESVADAYRGMGYAAGSERLWQIHLSTLYATGQAASVMGERFLTQDLMHQAFKVPAYDMPDSPGDYIVDAYLDGLNSYVRNLDQVPPEFARANTVPREFSRHDVASRYRFTGWFQHKTWVEKIYVGKLMAQHGTAWFKNLVRRFSTEDAEMVAELQEAMIELDPAVARLLYPTARIESGSNNWAIRGNLSASGKPVLATDPHQPYSIPNVFFYCHLSAPDWDAFGASFPGVPYFMMGFNQDVSWGLTTGFVDNYDVYIDRSNEVEIRDTSYAINIADGTSRDFKIAETNHGPVLESLTDALGITDITDRNYLTSLDWVMRDIPTSAGTLALMPLAKNTRELGEALFENDICPLVNNIICVDKDNSLHRYIATTIRKRVGVTGIVPIASWRQDRDFELANATELLVEVDPGKGYSLTANNDTMGERGEFPIHNFPTFDARARRIEQLLGELASNMRVADFESMQLDLVDLRAKDWVPEFVSCLNEDSEELNRARELLENWDCVASEDSAAACIYYSLLDRRCHIQFMEQVLNNKLVHSIPEVALSLNRFSVSDFMSDDSPWQEHRHILEAIICREVTDIVQILSRDYGDNWRWGDLHKVRIKHSLSRHAPWQNMSVGPDPVGGSPTTLRMAMHNPPLKDSLDVDVYHGPSFRWIVDMNDPLHFRFVIAGGNGGRTDSDYLSNQYNHWLEGRYYDVSLVRSELDILSTHQFT
jgi:penicillin amidase